eukprot:IDg9063t1
MPSTFSLSYSYSSYDDDDALAFLLVVADSHRNCNRRNFRQHSSVFRREPNLVYLRQEAASTLDQILFCRFSLSVLAANKERLRIAFYISCDAYEPLRAAALASEKSDALSVRSCNTDQKLFAALFKLTEKSSLLVYRGSMRRVTVNLAPQLWGHPIGEQIADPLRIATAPSNLTYSLPVHSPENPTSYAILGVVLFSS